MNNFKEYWQVMRQALPILVVISLAAAVLAYAVAANMAPQYRAHYSYLISLASREERADYRFDGYYAIQATDLFAATLAGWIRSPETIVAAFNRSDLAVPTQNPRDLTRIVKSEKTAPQLVQVTITGTTPQEVEALTGALKQVMEDNVRQYHEQGTPALEFRVMATKPWASVSRVAVPVITAATFVLVFFIALNVLLLIESVKRG